MPEFLETLAGSPWLYALVFVVSALDALLPFMPSETAVIAVGVLAASGRPHPAWVIVLAAAGAFVGDNLAYQVGRRFADRRLGQLLRRRRWRARYEWALRTMRERGGLIIVVGRYLPGGRVTTMVAAGALRYPVGRFRLFDAAATGIWAVWSVLLGYLGGAAFDRDPVKGMLLAFGLATGITIVVEVVRRVWASRRGADPAGRPAAPRALAARETAGQSYE